MGERTCPICGKPLKRDMEYRWPKTCSRSCGQKLRRGPEDQRFWSAVDATGGDESCWPWTKNRNRQGYGAVGWFGKVRKAHRVAYELVTGENITGLDIRHTCDNPQCCNPRHLRAGTTTDNMRDMAAKGRSGNHKGTANGRAKIGEPDVCEIREALNMGESQQNVANRFGIHQTSVSQIKCGVKWTHVVCDEPWAS